MKMMIFLSRKGTILAGETIDLHHGVEGFDGYNIRYQWIYDKPGESRFRNAEGVNEVPFSIISSAKSMSGNRRQPLYPE